MGGGGGQIMSVFDVMLDVLHTYQQWVGLPDGQREGLLCRYSWAGGLNAPPWGVSLRSDSPWMRCSGLVVTLSVGLRHV